MNTTPEPPKPACGARHPVDAWLRCTEPEDHKDGHIARGSNDEILATWPAEGGQQ